MAVLVLVPASLVHPRRLDIVVGKGGRRCSGKEAKWFGIAASRLLASMGGRLEFARFLVVLAVDLALSLC